MPEEEDERDVVDLSSEEGDSSELDEEEEVGDGEGDDGEEDSSTKQDDEEEEEEDSEDDIPAGDFDLLEDVPQVEERVVTKEERVTKPFLNVYEEVQILATRTRQLLAGAKPMVRVRSSDNCFPKAEEVARKELEEGVVPLLLYRRLPGGKVEEWRVEEMLNVKHRSWVPPR